MHNLLSGRASQSTNKQTNTPRHTHPTPPQTQNKQQKRNKTTERLIIKKNNDPTSSVRDLYLQLYPKDPFYTKNHNLFYP